tara:strand:- start:1777 stop:2727 length:951 start_codon:yes stop_codon:yes gene_type:complete
MKNFLRVLSFNLYWGGHLKPLEKTIEVIKSSGADLIGIQENLNRDFEDQTPKIAKAIGFSYVRGAILDSLEKSGGNGNKIRARWTQQAGEATLSRFPIISQSPGGFGIQVKTDFGKNVWIFNTHLWHYPYVPYQLLNTKYHGGEFIDPKDVDAENKAILSARISHETEITKILLDIKSVIDLSNPVFLTGDFNEPSHLDWTKKAAKAGIHPIKIDFPTSKQVLQTGLQDAYRKLYPNSTKHPGFTWPAGQYPESPNSYFMDPKDRIDFIYFVGNEVNVKKVEILGEEGNNSNISFLDYPSDHRAVLATFQIEANKN